MYPGGNAPREATWQILQGSLRVAMEPSSPHPACTQEEGTGAHKAWCVNVHATVVRNYETVDPAVPS